MDGDPHLPTASPPAPPTDQAPPPTDQAPPDPASLRAVAPGTAWRALHEGNARFVGGTPEHPNQDAGRRVELAGSQHPFAVLLGCSDSRIAAEIIFDRGLGDLFVVRTAGHVVDVGVLGSVEYGVSVLGAPLVVVLGHDHCGAVEATLEARRTGVMPGGFVRDVVERVTPSLLMGGLEGAIDVTDENATARLVDHHVRHTAEFLVQRSRVLSDAVAGGRCAVVGATYSLADGRVRQVWDAGTLADPDGAPADGAHPDGAGLPEAQAR